MGLSIYCVFKVLVRRKVRHGRIIPPNHTRESYPESYPRIIPPNHTSSQTFPSGHGLNGNSHMANMVVLDFKLHILRKTCRTRTNEQIFHVFFLDGTHQLMVNCWFGSPGFGILRVPPLSNTPFHFRGSLPESKPPGNH